MVGAVAAADHCHWQWDQHVPTVKQVGLIDTWVLSYTTTVWHCPESNSFIHLLIYSTKFISYSHGTIKKENMNIKDIAWMSSRDFLPLRLCLGWPKVALAFLWPEGIDFFHTASWCLIWALPLSSLGAFYLVLFFLKTQMWIPVKGHITRQRL